MQRISNQWAFPALASPLFLALFLGGCSDGANGEIGEEAVIGADGGAPDRPTDGSGDADTPSTDLSDECRGNVGFINLGLMGLDAAGLSAPIQFEVPACAPGFTLLVAGPDSVTFTLARLTNPNGDDIITSEFEGVLNPMVEMFLGPFPGQFLSPNRMSSSTGTVVALVPSSSAVSFVPGRYEAVIQGATVGGTTGTALTPYQGDVIAEVIWKTADTLPVGGVIDLNLFFTGAGGITAATGPDSLLIGGALEVLNTSYGQMNLAIGEVRYFDVDSQYQTINELQGPDADLSALFRLSDGHLEGLNLFFIERFEVMGMPGGSLAGVAGGLPGPPLRTGTTHSGVAVALEMAASNPEVLGHVMAHEGGHYLGLFHTIEFFGTLDPLDDTPDDDSNLMFPTVGGNTLLTADQAAVVHVHAEVAQ